MSGPESAGPAPQVVVEAEGEIDVVTAPALDAQLREAFEGSTGAVAVDFGAVTFMDSSGLKVLLKAASRAAAEHRGFSVLNPTRELIRLAWFLRVSDVLGLPTP